MRTIRGILPLVPPLRYPIVALGTFDGVHLGHQQLLRQAIAWAKSENGEAVVITFEEHPRIVLSGRRPLFITSLEHRLSLFEQIGLDICVVLGFDLRLAATPAEEFVQRVLVAWLGMKGIILGHGQRFGHGRKGDIELLHKMAPRYGFLVREIAPVKIHDRVVSSTAIRERIAKGDLAAAAEMLGRPVSVMGTVVRGGGLGRQIGFPTANLDLHHEVRPPLGVYRTIAKVRTKNYPSLTNIGPKPAFNAAPSAIPEEMRVEVHILDFTDDLYGQTMEVSFLEKMRDHRTFLSPKALRDQIAEDVSEARRRFAQEVSLEKF